MKFKSNWSIILSLCLLTQPSACRKDISPFGTYIDQKPAETEYKEAIIVYFKDKNNNKYTLLDPSSYLSDKAIQRRKIQKIAIDSTDLPVSRKYLSELLKESEGKLLNTSKWLNYAVIHLPEHKDNLEKIKSLSFVASIKTIGVHLPYQEPVVPPIKNETPFAAIASTNILDTLKVGAVNYGKTYGLLQQYEANLLHEKKFFGKGKTIAILSEGFGYLDEKPELIHLISEQKIKDSYDLLYNRSDISTTTTNGNNLLAMLGAINPQKFIGLSPKADYILLRTDQNGSQEPFYETSWVAGVERADSLGVDIISSSCVYGVKFNQPQFDMKAEQADGRSISSRVADQAFKKGIITVQMFPQESNGITFILPPADAKDIITAGNINKRNKPLWNVLNKPTADGRIKPELAVLAQEIPVIYGWGDSYSTSDTPPILAGLIACLWEALPNKNAKEIKELLQQTASQSTNPDNKLGYGVPNFKKAYEQAK
ncbi:MULTISPECIES: S8 family serine peptidase [Sphingobacterium]|uniref:S8 family serine peptidase n=1 Tax=Sphingobacterium hotanense TaxID=649196 RepID=A0ABT7NMP8_9SPHI|nr:MULTISPECIES: S8 family serine peptidase [Sphingobacterium]MDM1048535.1 S8 family serine peptidase [Sphingobacterium hotanense]